MVYTQEGEKIFDALVEKINKFDLFYEMSDSNTAFNRGLTDKYKVIALIKDLIPSEKKEIYNKLNNNGKLCWDRYFKNC